MKEQKSLFVHRRQTLATSRPTHIFIQLKKYADERELGITVDCAISNGGGIRTSVEPGDISMDTLVTVFPFETTYAL